MADYLADDLEEDARDFVPTAVLVDALDVEPGPFGRQMTELGCRPDRRRIATGDRTVRQVRGYLFADIRNAITSAINQAND